MANYNTFIAIDCKRRKNLLTTSSARKVRKIFKVGVKIEVWNENELKEVIYYSKYKKDKNAILKYVSEEKEYIRRKQEIAERKNNRRKQRQ